MKIPKGLRVCYSIAADFAARFKADMLGTYAASAAFFIFVSLFPCFLLAVAILDLCGIAGWVFSTNFSPVHRGMLSTCSPR